MGSTGDRVPHFGLEICPLHRDSIVAKNRDSSANASSAIVLTLCHEVSKLYGETSREVSEDVDLAFGVPQACGQFDSGEKNSTFSGRLWEIVVSADGVVIADRNDRDRSGDQRRGIIDPIAEATMDVKIDPI